MSEQSMMSAPVRTSTEKTPRLLFVDNLRSTIIILVILHHIAVIYSGSGSFYYIETNDALATGVLSIFTALNQEWFMGALFLLSGYFSPGAFDRRGMRSFLKSRLLRLGIPLVFYFFVLNPVASIGIYQMPQILTHITSPLSWQDYPHLIGVGPLWFAEMLLIFDFGYAACRWLTRHRTTQSMDSSRPPGYLAMGIYIMALALVSYILWIPLPLDTAVLGFPTPAWLPQYLSLFCIGIAASRGDWLRTIPSSMGKWGFVAAMVATFTLFPVALIGATTGTPAPVLGGGHWQSAAFALWYSTFAVGIILALIALFRRFLDHQGWLGRLLSQQSFAVYVIHAPILVLLALALRGVHAENLLKCALLAVIAVPLCFAVAWLIRKMPLASRVL